MRTDKKSSLQCQKCSAKVTVEALSCARFAKDWLDSTPANLKLAYVLYLVCSGDTEMILDNSRLY
jgi:hypothetical protein